MDKRNNSGNKNSGNKNSGNCNSGNYNSGDDNSGNCNPGRYNSGNYNSGHWNSGNCNPGHYNSGDCNSGDYNSGYYNSGSHNSGHYNSGNCNSGLFNRNSPKLRIFEKETDLTMTEFRKKYGYPEVYPILTGYKNNKLVTHEYKDAWQIMWNKATDEQKQWYLDLPNFDPQVFCEITSIDVRE